MRCRGSCPQQRLPSIANETPTAVVVPPYGDVGEFCRLLPVGRFDVRVSICRVTWPALRVSASAVGGQVRCLGLAGLSCRAFVNALGGARRVHILHCSGLMGCDASMLILTSLAFGWHP